MEKQFAGIPVLQKSKEVKQPTASGAVCCTQPANASACCTPVTSTPAADGACCVQPTDGSACCDK